MLRMRQGDEYTFDGKAMIGTICNQEPSSEEAFGELIRKARAVPGLLPPWWDETSLEQCLEYSRKSSGFFLRHAQEKHTIQKTWNDDRMPMKLRMVAERVYGYSPGGAKSDQMLAGMIRAESGDGTYAFMSHMQLNLN